MTGPAQAEGCARAALGATAAALDVDVQELTVLEAVRRRRAGSKIPFHSVTIQAPSGSRLRYQMSDDGARVEPAL
jgi:hypothetical protein